MVDDFEHSVLIGHVKLLERAYFFSNDWQYFFQVIDTQTFKYIFDDSDCQRFFDGGFLWLICTIFLLNTNIAKERDQFAYFLKLAIALNYSIHTMISVSTFLIYFYKRLLSLVISSSESNFKESKCLLNSEKFSQSGRENFLREVLITELNSERTSVIIWDLSKIYLCLRTN